MAQAQLQELVRHNDSHNDTTCTVLFFTDDDFLGTVSQFFLGQYTLQHAQYFGFPNNQVSSFKIFGNGACQVTLYGGESLNGWQATFYTGEWRTTAAIAGGFYNDDVSSFIVGLAPPSEECAECEPEPAVPTTVTVTSITFTSRTGTSLTRTFTSTSRTTTTRTWTSRTHTSTSHTHTSLTHTSHTHTSITHTWSSTTRSSTTRTSTTGTTVTTFTETTITTRTTPTSTTSHTTVTSSTTTFTVTTHTGTDTTASTTTTTASSATATTQTTLTSTTQTLTTATATGTSLSTVTATTVTATETTVSHLRLVTVTYTTVTPTATHTRTIGPPTSSTTTSATTTVTTGTLTTTASRHEMFTNAFLSIANGDFEQGSSTNEYEYNCHVPGWVTTPSMIRRETVCPIFIKDGRAVDAPFGGTEAIDGRYFIALRRYGASLSQKVPGHISGHRYRLEFYAAKRNLMNDDPVVRVKIDEQPFVDFPITMRSMEMLLVEYVPNSTVVTITIENFSPNQYSTVFIDAVQIMEKPALPARCSDLLYHGAVWGKPGSGIDVARYTSGTLKWMGCNGNGCEKDSFYCYDTAGVGMEFGTSSRKAMRALLGSSYPILGHDCATPTTPHDMFNSLDHLSDLHELCLQLGYPTGEIVKRGPKNNCPEVNWNQSTGSWTSDFQRSDGYGKEFRCLEISTTTTSTQSITYPSFSETTTATTTFVVAANETNATATTTTAARSLRLPVVENGDFERGLVTATVIPNPAEMQGWFFTPKVFFVRSGRPASMNFGGVGGAHGAYFMACQSAGASVSQFVPGHVAGRAYELYFLVAARKRSPKHTYPDPTVRLLVDGAEVYRFTPTGQEFVPQRVPYRPNFQEAKFKFENVSPPGDRTFFIDDIRIAESSG